MRNNRDRGDRGVAGERGPKGDHGQEGERGKTGETGADGAAAPFLSRRRTLVIFAFVVLAFLLLALRIEVNSHRIQQGVYQDCLTRAVAAKTTPDCEHLR